MENIFQTHPHLIDVDCLSGHLTYNIHFSYLSIWSLPCWLHPWLCGVTWLQTLPERYLSVLPGGKMRRSKYSYSALNGMLELWNSYLPYKQTNEQKTYLLHSEEAATSSYSFHWKIQKKRGEKLGVLRFRLSSPNKAKVAKIWKLVTKVLNMAYTYQILKKKYRFWKKNHSLCFLLSCLKVLWQIWNVFNLLHFNFLSKFSEAVKIWVISVFRGIVWYVKTAEQCQL